jgi:hypothetical protein
MKPIVCPCGLEKELIRGYAVCTKHCDHVVCKPNTGCPHCTRYQATVGARINTEYAKEKRDGSGPH